MSCKRKLKTYVKIEDLVINENCSKEDILKLEKQLNLALNQKIQKLTVLIKNMNVYQTKNALIINDAYGTCKDLCSVIESFGMTVKEVNDGLTGKTYVVSDPIINCLHQLGASTNFGFNVASADLERLADSVVNTEIDKKTLSIMESIRTTGSYSIKAKHRYSDYSDGSTGSDGYEYSGRDEKALMAKALNKSNNVLQQQNDNLQNGTTEVLKTRAKQLGYSVEKKVVNNQVQLVLVKR